MASVVTLGLQLGVNGTIWFWSYMTSYNPADLKKAEEDYVLGLEFLQKMRRYPDALKLFVSAKEHFEKTLFAFSPKNSRLHQLYTNVSYSLALTYIHCGKLDKAEQVIDVVAQRMKDWKSSYRDVDLINLRGIICLKRGPGKFADGLRYFDESLGVDANQQEIIFLRCFLLAKTTEKNLSANQNYIIHSRLFKPDIIHPLAFEINMAFLTVLFDAKQYLSCFEKLQILEINYTGIELPYADRSGIYELMLKVLEKLKSELKEEKIESQEQLQGNFLNALLQAPTPKPKLTKAQAEDLTSAYEKQNNGGKKYCRKNSRTKRGVSSSIRKFDFYTPKSNFCLCCNCCNRSRCDEIAEEVGEAVPHLDM